MLEGAAHPVTVSQMALALTGLPPQQKSALLSREMALLLELMQADGVQCMAIAAELRRARQELLWSR